MVDYQLNAKGAQNLANAVFESSIRCEELMNPDWDITTFWLLLAGTTYDYYYKEYVERTQNPRFDFNKIPHEYRDFVRDYIKDELTIDKLLKKYKTSSTQLYRILERYHIPHRKHGGGSCKL